MGDIKGVVSTMNPGTFGRLANIDVGAQVAPRPRPDAAKVFEYSKDLLDIKRYPQVLEYLTGNQEGQRQLKEEVLLTYGIGARYYSFTGKSGESNQHLCMTFPWLSITKEGSLIAHRVKARSMEHKHMQKLDPVGGEWGT